MRAVILAGGKGTRLKPYTTVFPKPLVPVDDMPIVEIVIRQLKTHGFTRVTLSVGHLAELLIAYFGDGKKLGIPIEYSKEDQPLGTTGALALIPDLNQTFLTMNGDILTTIDFTDLIDYHRRNQAVATIAMHKRSVKIDLGVIQTNGNNEIIGYIEKPTYDYSVSMGIYIFEPHVLDYIRPGERLDLPDLIHLLLQNGEKVMGYPSDCYWLDIGRPDDYEQAVAEFSRLRGQFLREE
jgi:NDP-sugar pyrophosphorylase family protein